VTTSFTSARGGPQTVTVENSSGNELDGVTLTFAREVGEISSEGVQVRPVQRTDCDGQDCRIVVGGPANGTLDAPTRQVVLDGLKPGRAELRVEWTRPAAAQ
jgi:hypothetical protein